MTKVTGCHNQELQQQLSTKNSPTTFDGIPIFQLVKTHQCALTKQLTVYGTKNHQKLASGPLHPTLWFIHPIHII